MREKFYQKVASGSLDDRLIEIEVKEQNGNLVSVEFMPIMGEEIDSLRDNFANLFPKKKKIKKFKVKDAIKYFQQEESEKLIDQENINKIAIERADQLGITGTVKNLYDGSVEIFAFGDALKLEAFKKWCYRGPRDAFVKQLECQKIAFEEVKGFETIG